jgi:predicted transcriptional regulator
MTTPPRIPQRPSVSVRLPVSTAERLDDLARAMGRRRSDVLRRAVDELLDRLTERGTR